MIEYNSEYCPKRRQEKIIQLKPRYNYKIYAMLNFLFRSRVFPQLCTANMKSLAEEISGPQNTSVFAPSKHQVYTIVSSCEQQLTTGVLQSDHTEDEQNILCDLSTLLSHYPTQGKGGFSFGNPSSDDPDDEEEGDTVPSNAHADINLIESFLIMIRQMWRARDFEDFSLAVIQFLKSYTGKSACAMIGTVVQYCISLLKENFGNLQSEEEDEGYNPFTHLRELMENASALTQHPLLTKFKKVLWYILSFATLSKLGVAFDSFFYSQAEKEALLRQESSKTSYLVSVLESFVSILERLMDCYRTGSWSPLIASSTSYGAWVDAVYDLRVKATHLHNPEACGFSYPQFLGEMEDAIEKGRAIVKYETDRSIANGMKKLLSELEMIKATECTKKAARASRDAPFALLYYGGSSIAKTTLQDLTHIHFAKTHQLPEGDEYKYCRIASDEYYSGFQSQMYSIIIDDIANLNPNLGMDPSMAEVLQIRNNASFCPPQADLSDKGKTPVLCQLFQASTNTKDLNAHAYYCNTLAIMRRWNFVVTISLKGEYSQTIGGSIPEANCRMMDSSKVPLLQPGDYPDLWDFTVEKVIADVNPAGKQQPKYEPVLMTSSIYEYLAFVSRESTLHRAQQKQIRDSSDMFKRSVVCPDCYFPNYHCKCPPEELQSREVAIASLGAIASLVSLFVVGPKIRKAAVDSTSRLATDIGRQAAMNLLKEAEDAVAPKLIEALRSEGYLPTESVTDPAIEAIEARMLDMEMPVAPIASWYDTIVARVNRMHLPLVDRLHAERTWVKGKMEKFGLRIAKLHRNITSDPILSQGYAVMIVTLSSMAGIMLATKFAATFLAQKKKTKGKAQSAWQEGAENFPRDEKVNPWFRDEYVPAKFEYSPLTCSWKSLEKTDVQARVQRNVMHVVSTYTNGSGKQVARNFRILCLEGNMFVTNSHNIPVDNVDFAVNQNPTTSGVNDQFKVRMHPGDFYRSPNKDLVFFTIRHIPPRASISGLLASKNFKTVCEGVMLSRSDKGEPETYELRAIKNTCEVNHEIGEVHGYRAECEIVTPAGQCGSPYIGYTGLGPVLLGIHIIGGVSKSVACVNVSSEDLSEALTALKVETVQAGVPDLTDVDGSEIALLPLHHKSTFRYIEHGCADVYGSLPGVRVGGKSKVEKTLIHDEMLEVGYVPKVGPPVMQGWKPWRLATLDIVQQEYLIDVPALDKCVESFSEDILGRLAPEDLLDIQVLSGRATVNGLPGVQYIDKINRNTSMGFPWNGPKNRYLDYCGKVDMWDDYVDFKPEIYTRVDAMLEKYKRGEQCMPIFKYHLKDEVVPQSKIDSGKTRVFAGCPLPFGLLMRKYFLGSARCLQRNRFIFEAAPGTNATSLEWCNIYHYLTAFGVRRIVAGDFSKFDKKMSPVMILGAGVVLLNLAKAAGWSREQMRIALCMIYDLAYPIGDVNGDLVRFWGSNPSGHPLTVIINSIANSLYMRYAWLKSGHVLSMFQLLVHLLTYGDDNIMGISEEVENFDHTVIQAELAKIGVVYTMADKERPSVPFVNIDEVSFLKRSFVFNEDVGSFVAQLEHDSIEKGLLFHIPSKTVCKEQLAVDSMDNALREYFFYGRKKYEERRAIFEMVIMNMDLEPYFDGFPSYDGLVERYIENGKCYSVSGKCSACAA